MLGCYTCERLVVSAESCVQVGAAFGAAGQRCMAISAVVFVGEAKHLLAAVVDKARALVVNCGQAEGADVGPLISREALQRARRIVDTSVAQGASLPLDGRDVQARHNTSPLARAFQPPGPREGANPSEMLSTFLLRLEARTFCCRCDGEPLFVSGSALRRARCCAGMRAGGRLPPRQLPGPHVAVGRAHLHGLLQGGGVCARAQLLGGARPSPIPLPHPPLGGRIARVERADHVLVVSAASLSEWRGSRLTQN